MGSELADAPGPDLLGLLIGSEGTLGIATKITVRILRKPEAVQTLLAAFDTIEAGGAAVSDIIGAGIVPAAIEMMDRLAIEAAEAAVHPGFPASDTVLIVELDGPAAEVRASSARSKKSAGRTAPPRSSRADRGPASQDLEGRKAAFAAMGRVSPNYYVQDGVVPRTRLPEVLIAFESWSGGQAAHRQRLPRGRRQPASSHLLRRECQDSLNRLKRSRPRSSDIASRRADRSPASTASAPTSRGKCRACSTTRICR